MRRCKIDRAVFEIDDDPVEPAIGHDLHGLHARDGGDGAEGRTSLAPELAQAVERLGGGGHLRKFPAKNTPRDRQASSRPPKNGISVSLSPCRRFDVNIISAPVWLTPPSG